MSKDTIDRQAAIDAIDKEQKEIGVSDASAIYECSRFKTIIKRLPPAQPEPKRGTWILDRSGAYCCSKCMEPCAGYVMMRPRDKFCKMCGSRNEVTE